jgi:hypothetical protein
MDGLFFRGRHRPVWRRCHWERHMLLLLATDDASERSDRRAKLVKQIDQCSIRYMSRRKLGGVGPCCSVLCKSKDVVEALRGLGGCPHVAQQDKHQNYNNKLPPRSANAAADDAKGNKKYYHGATNGRDCTAIIFYWQ